MAGDDVDEGGLTGAVRSNNTDDLAFLELHAQVIGGLDRAEIAADIACLEYRRHTCSAVAGRTSRWSGAAVNARRVRRARRRSNKLHNPPGANRMMTSSTPPS